MNPKTMRTLRLLLICGMTSLAIVLAGIYLQNWLHKKQIEAYQIPDVVLYNQDNQPVPLVDYLASDKPIVLQFIYTGCTTVCPIMIVKFANLQRRLEPDTTQAKLVSISIDPENDTPAVLGSYKKNFDGKPGWDFLTGTHADISAVMAAFRTQPTDMSTMDSPVLLKAPGAHQWIRLTGQIDSNRLWKTYQQIKTRHE
ncbi:MAG: SCO family protein [Desulfuromonas sp.]|mgnify:CR=1 FL=1|nr:MAG: SCO family protein [Desulfuromonas sp.]